MGSIVDVSGMRFGNLTVAEMCEERASNGKVLWKCVCDCGNTTRTDSYSLRLGKTKSCGCVGRARIGKETRKYPKDERVVFKKEWQAWIGMNRRCTDEKSQDYKDYMERGIKVCQEWENDFLDFLHHIGPSPKDGQRWSVGRMDNNLGYQYGNVEWQLDNKQARNHSLQRNNKTGVVGVALCECGGHYGSPYYMAYWNELDGKRKSKCFSTWKYGEKEAFNLACEHRTSQIKRLNELGAEYAESHGKSK